MRLVVLSMKIDKRGRQCRPSKMCIFSIERVGSDINFQAFERNPAVRIRMPATTKMTAPRRSHFLHIFILQRKIHVLLVESNQLLYL